MLLTHGHHHDPPGGQIIGHFEMKTRLSGLIGDQAGIVIGQFHKFLSYPRTNSSFHQSTTITCSFLEQRLLGDDKRSVVIDTSGEPSVLINHFHQIRRCISSEGQDRFVDNHHGQFAAMPLLICTLDLDVHAQLFPWFCLFLSWLYYDIEIPIRKGDPESGYPDSFHVLSHLFLHRHDGVSQPAKGRSHVCIRQHFLGNLESISISAAFGLLRILQEDFLSGYG